MRGTLNIIAQGLPGYDLLTVDEIAHLLHEGGVVVSAACLNLTAADYNREMGIHFNPQNSTCQDWGIRQLMGNDTTGIPINGMKAGFDLEDRIETVYWPKYKKPLPTLAQAYATYRVIFMSASLNGFLIGVSGALFQYAAKAMNDWENHRLQNEYDRAMVMKNFVFQFLNNYFVMFCKSDPTFPRHSYIHMDLLGFSMKPTCMNDPPVCAYVA